MKLTQQANECKRINREAHVENGDCGQANLENRELCIRTGADGELVRSEEEWVTTSSVSIYQALSC